jgi:hypothetical protein
LVALALQNIDPIFILQPAIVITVCTALLVYLRKRRGFQLRVLSYSFVAYAVAIGLKYAVQLPTIGWATNYFGEHSIGLGVYYGAQTMFIEVGLAFAVAWYAVRNGRLGKRDAEGYGAGLAFWENAVLLGALSLINLVAYYAIISTNSPLAQTVHDLLERNSPGLFDPILQGLISVAFGTIERLSSIMIHLAWGYLCVMAAVYGKKRLLLVAMPMGLVDFLVPFATSIGLVRFEALVFTISVVSLFVARQAVRHVERGLESSNPNAPVRGTTSSSALANLHSNPLVAPVGIFRMKPVTALGSIALVD